MIEHLMPLIETHWFKQEGIAWINYRNARAMGYTATMMYDHNRDEWRVKIWKGAAR